MMTTPFKKNSSNSYDSVGIGEGPDARHSMTKDHTL